ncbi:Major facilitator superfamily transporter [Apiospora phragmitis]|uniref:Major facilitator superfamily transporter n=1 Tax=Apiospora phragmitis TaxID=2905665 RepID=A0ABR1VE31_9PEZI
MAEQRDVVDDAREDTATTASEATPLLQSDTGSRWVSASTSSSSAILRDVDDGPDHVGSRQQQQQQRKKPAVNDDGEANYKVSRGRGLAIMISANVERETTACNMSGMTMAQSTIAADLDAYDDAMWFTSAYLIALSSLAPLTGRLASIFSPRLMVLVASLFFAAGGLVTALAGSFGVFILGRVLSGMGGSAIMVLAFILVLELTSRRRRGLFVGMVNAGFTTGISLGAVVFGVMIPTAGWRALFAIQVPAGLIAGLGVYFAIPRSFSYGQDGKETSTKEKLKNIDYLGAVVLTSTIVLLLYSLSAQIQVVPLAISAGTLVMFVLIEYFVASDPIIPIAVLQNRGALLSCLSQLGFMTARWTILFYAPITALAVFGLSPGASGSMLIPTNLGFGIGGILIGWVHIRRAGSFYVACLVCVALFAVTMFALSLSSNPAVPGALYVALLFANGVFTGATINYTLAHLLHLTTPDTHYVGTSLLGTFRGFAGSFGSAIGGGIFVRTLRAGLERGYRALDGESSRLTPERAQLVKRLVGSPALVYGGGLGEADRWVAVQGYVDALRVLFQAAAVLSLVVLLVQSATGWRGPSDVAKDPEEAGNNGRSTGVVPREGEELDD